MSTTVVIGWGSEDRFDGATVTADSAPQSSYALTTFGRRDPATRICWSVTDLVLTFTLAAPQRGDVLVVPCANLDEGTLLTTVLRLTNGAGLDIPVPVPAMQQNGIPRTIVVDVAAAEPNATTRTSDVWNLEITGNASAITFGGLVCLFPKRTLEVVDWGLSYTKRQHRQELTNEHGRRVRTNLRTNTRAVTFSMTLEAADAPDVEDWYDASSGSVDPTLLWIQLAELDALVGTLGETFAAQQQAGAFVYKTSFDFAELSKGKPV